MELSERVMSWVGVVTLGGAVLAAAGCGGATSRHSVADATKTVRRCVPHAAPLGSSSVAWAAAAVRPLVAYRSPGGVPLRRFGLVNVNGVDTVFGALGERVGRSCAATWVHVQLPVRPNGAEGWVRARAVRLLPVHTRITVDLSQRRLRFYRGTRLVLSAPAAIGSSATPTPVGRYYVNQRLVPADAGGPYGPGAIGISAFSPVLTGWTQGGPIAIHGTNEPWSIGHAVSNGCIRIPNADVRRLFPQALAGTPVVISR